MTAQAGIKIAGRNINNLRYADDTTLMADSEEELKSLLMRVKVESEKVGLKLNIQKMKIMAPGPVTGDKRINSQFVALYCFKAVREYDILSPTGECLRLCGDLDNIEGHLYGKLPGFLI